MSALGKVHNECVAILGLRSPDPADQRRVSEPSLELAGRRGQRQVCGCGIRRTRIRYEILGLGAKLFPLAFSDEVKDCLRRSLDLARQQDAGLRVRLRLKDAGELANYPWEYLYDRPNNRFLSLSHGTPVVRYLDLSQTISPLTVHCH
jgi:hypothetical protein